jgi:pyruvate-formate lyase-activating enzyme
MRVLDFRDHRRELDQNAYVYAVVSRRSQGLSIGINLNPDKVCNFDCPYCQVDRSLPGGPREVRPEALRREIDHLLSIVRSGELWTLPPFHTAASEWRRVSDLAFAGDGEPTSCPTFPEAIEEVAASRAAHGLESVPMVVLTNATLLHRPRVAAAVDRLHALGGHIWGKLDAGTEEWFQRVDGTRLPFRRVLDNLLATARRHPITLQCMFLTLEGQGPSEAEVGAWAGRIADILSGGGQIRLVQVYSVARRPTDSRVGVLPLARLQEIAARAQALGVTTSVHPGIEAQPIGAPACPPGPSASA